VFTGLEIYPGGGPVKNKVKDYCKVTENPCSMCMPMGGILPFKGVAGAMVLLHGSQGCATYMRRYLAEHFNEPVDVASSLSLIHI
jgi:nitrogenase molybdenum-iron protein NifN